MKQIIVGLFDRPYVGLFCRSVRASYWKTTVKKKQIWSECSQRRSNQVTMQ